jgi:DNA-binding NtrC family response regulator
MRHRILVVAEDVTLRSTLARWLMPAGYFVELAETDRRAREVLADQRMALTIVAPSHCGRSIPRAETTKWQTLASSLFDWR